MLSRRSHLRELPFGLGISSRVIFHHGPSLTPVFFRPWMKYTMAGGGVRVERQQTQRV